MSSKQRLETLDSWLFQIKLTTKKQRVEALKTNNIEAVEYFKHLIDKKKHNLKPLPIKKIHIYEEASN